MADGSSNALVRVTMPNMPVPSRHRAEGSRFVDDDLLLNNREEVRQQLPDIMGQALARIWIDPEFHRTFAADPVGTLRESGVFLPETMSIEFSVSASERPKVIVYEQPEGSRFKMRVFYLQLVMLAGR